MRTHPIICVIYYAGITQHLCYLYHAGTLYHLRNISRGHIISPTCVICHAGIAHHLCHIFHAGIIPTCVLYIMRSLSPTRVIYIMRALFHTCARGALSVTSVICYAGVAPHMCHLY